ncbi:MAG: acetylglutamate kinase [Ignavibacteria bacterium]|nr:acetylglutamate kinase [Ignavibacteria bacterium]
MKTVLLKLSGKALDNLFVNDSWIKIIKELKDSFDALVIVHGAGAKISEWCQAMGYESKFYNGQRVTDEGTMEIVAAVQAGLLNARLVSRLQTSKINAIGLTGIDNGLFTAEYFNGNLGYVGFPVLSGNKNWLYSIMQNRIVPVFSSVCRDKEGNLMNINADIFAKELAIAIEADTVLFLSDICGVKLSGTLHTVVNETDINEGILTGQITDGMIPKLQSCLELIKHGIHKVWIGNDLSNQNFKELVFEKNLKGTWIVESKTIAG